MTTITIKINEQTSKGKEILEFLKTQGIEIVYNTKKREAKSDLMKKALALSKTVEKNDITMQEIIDEVRDVRNGNLTLQLLQKQNTW